MSETQTMHFTYDPIHLTKMLLQMYVEQEIEGKTYKARQFALYDYLHNLSDEECEGIVRAYAEQENLTEITFAEWKNDCKIMIDIIEQTDRFKDVLQQKRLAGVHNYEFEEGKGISGILTPDGVFLKCGHQEHSIIADRIDWQDQINSIYFSSPMQYGKGILDGGIVTMSPLRQDEVKPNTAQNEWIKEHFKYLDGTQPEYIERLNDTQHIRRR